MSEVETADRLARIETKLDLLIEDRGRLSAVEKRQWLHTGGMAVAAVVAAKFGVFLPK